MIEVREARLNEVSKIVPLCRRLHAESAWSWVPFSPSAMRKSLKQMIAMEHTKPLVAWKDGEPCGILFGTVDEVIYGRTRYATDIDFVAEFGGDELVDAFKSWAQSMGAKVVLMGVTNPGREQAKDRFFGKHGLSRVGGMYLERLI